MVWSFNAALFVVLAVGPSSDFGPQWGDEDADNVAVDPMHRLRGYALPSVLDLDDLAVGLDLQGFEGLAGEVETPARLRAIGELSHPLDATVSGVTLAFSIVPAEDVERTHRRLTAPPLQLTQAELDLPMPLPVAAVQGEGAVVAHLEPGARAIVDLDLDLGQLTLDAERLPAYLLVVESYALELPTADDIVLILDRGGTADYAALMDWATRYHDDEDRFSEEDRVRVMKAVLLGFRRMRSPPALGDLQRLLALDRLMQTMAGPEDLEPLLKIERPIRILHAAALMTYDANAAEEAALGVPIHAMDLLPARSDFLIAPEVAMKALRPFVLDRLLELGFDPVDFRDTPNTSVRRRSRLQRQAEGLLAPLKTTDVVGVLDAAANETVARNALRFYVRARHAPAVDPLVEWLLAHPEEMGDLGEQALREIPDALLPAVMRRYLEPEDPAHRPLLRKYIQTMPARLGGQVLEILRAVGLDTSSYATAGGADVTGALDAYELVERKLARRRSEELVHAISDNGVDPLALLGSLRSVSRLAQLDPPAIEANADLIIDVLTAAALEFDEARPTDRSRALQMLETLPFGSGAAAAAAAQTMTSARLAHRAGRAEEALDLLLEHDPELENDDMREQWVGVMHEVFDARLSAGNYDLASALVDQAEAVAADDVDISGLRERLSWKRKQSAVIVGAIFGLVLAASVLGLALRAAVSGLQRWRKARREMKLLLRRQADAEASLEPVAEADASGSSLRVQGEDLMVEAEDDPPQPDDTPAPAADDEPAPPGDEDDGWGSGDPFDDGFEGDGLTDVFDEWADDLEEPGANDDGKMVS